MDVLLNATDNALRTLFAKPRASRACPTVAEQSTQLTTQEQAKAGALMRINHVGEVCAQALYAAQAGYPRSCPASAFPGSQPRRRRSPGLDQGPAGRAGRTAFTAQPLVVRRCFRAGPGCQPPRRPAQPGFVVETERQVEAHLATHLEKLPEGDHESRAIVAQMKDDEALHARAAEDAGALQLPAPVKTLMRLAAKVMTTTAHYI